MNHESSRSEAFRRLSEANELEAPRRSPLVKVIAVVAIATCIMLLAGGYVLVADVIGGQETKFPPLQELPPLGKIVRAEGPTASMSRWPKAGDEAPDFSFVDPSGETRKLSDYKGQAVLINFWATWCPYCIKEMPDIEAVYRAEQDKGFVVLGISLDEDADAARKFLQKRGITFPSLQETNSTTIALYRVQPIPASFFIDREGIIRDVQVGAMTKGVIQRKVDKIL